MRRSWGRGRILVGFGAIVCLVAMALPWITVGDTAFLTPTIRNGFDGAGILIFIASVLLLALLILPYASRAGESSLDRPLSYVALAGMGLVGLVLVVVTSVANGWLRTPDKEPGLWLAGFGTFVICWGVGELLAERPTTV